jgi:hypothetical protein
MESSEWLFSLWADSVSATPREVSRFSHCYAHYQQQKEPSTANVVNFRTAEERFYHDQSKNDDDKDDEILDPMVAAGTAPPRSSCNRSNSSFTEYTRLKNAVELRKISVAPSN